MCGIVGYVGERDAVSIVLDGLQCLEYRGYDSAGAAILTPGGLQIRRAFGKLANLQRVMTQFPMQGQTGIGHTRWATHGAPTEYNAHPHRSADGSIAVVHNGIVENHRQLRAFLMEQGTTFASDTDTEIIAHLIAYYVMGGQSLTDAVRCTADQLHGANAFVVMSEDTPDHLVAARLGHAGGVAIGLGQGENFIASDVPALLEHTDQFVFLKDREIACVTASDYTIQSLAGVSVTGEVHTINWTQTSTGKGKYDHFMQKEIFEQPTVITDTMRGRVDFDAGSITLQELNLDAERVRGLSRLVSIACGTSAYSALVGKFYFEKLARLHTEVDYASEYRYRDPIIDDTTAVLSITQSGETADTLAAMETAHSQGALLWSIVNASGSAATRLSDGITYMHAGPEIGVASTKAFTASLVDQYLMALKIGHLRGVLDDTQLASYVQDLARLPELAGRALDKNNAIRDLATQLHQYTNFLYLGRGINYPIALEGALKLKEISYIHAEGYPAGEMKHGPIALIDQNMPVLTIATQDDLYEKMISQIEQARARDGIVIAVATEGDTYIRSKANYVIEVPQTPPLLGPIINVLPLQLLAYHVAVLRGAEVDQPRNLAKSVTVE